LTSKYTLQAKLTHTVKMLRKSIEIKLFQADISPSLPFLISLDLSGPEIQVNLLKNQSQDGGN
jgi:hypothetical protein